jgi:glucokinase
MSDLSPTTCLGIEIGGSKLQIVEGDASARILRRWRATADRARGAEGIRDQLEQALRDEFPNRLIACIGVGFGGPVDHATGRIAVSHQVGGWNGFSLRDWLHEVTGAPVIVENDSNAAALGEAFAAEPDATPLFYFNLGSGVGGGLAIDRRIYHGAPPGECEFGHVRLDRHGATVESRCSGWAIDARIRDQRHRRPTILANLTSEMNGGEAKALPEALRQGDGLAQQILTDLADDLAFALSHVIHLFHPRALALGGGLSLIGEPLRAAIGTALPRYVMTPFLPPPPLHLARLGEDSVPIGALRLAITNGNVHSAP